MYVQPRPPAPPQRNWLLIIGIAVGVVVLLAVIVLAIVLPLTLSGGDDDGCRPGVCGMGVCIPRGDSFDCRCPTGYSGEYCEVSSNDGQGGPAPLNCKNGESMMTGDQQVCECFDGYEGNLCQYDINECQRNNGGCMTNCKNQIGTYECSCNEGSTLGPDGHTCLDDNECLMFPCDHGKCINMAGGYSCECDTGYTGKHCDEDIDECADGSHRCDRSCVNFVGGYQCECPLGQDLAPNGYDCERVSSCTSDTCKNGGTCRDTDVGIKCECTGAWEGNYCEFDRDECLTNNGGCEENCKNKMGSFECSCNGLRVLSDNKEDCQDVNECEVDAPCVHGECIDTSDGYRCLCDAGITGENCDQDIDECTEMSHACEGSCENIVPGFICSCPPGQMLLDNQVSCVDIKDCQEDSCVHGTCVEGVEGFTCDCQRGFGGEFCEIDMCDSGSGWILNEATGNCYKFYRTYETSSFYWGDGEALCQAQGGHMMSFSQPGEYQWIHQHIISKVNLYHSSGVPDQYIFVGLWVGDFEDTSTWYHTDGSEVNVGNLPGWYNSETSTSTYHCVYVDVEEINYGDGYYGELYRYDCDSSGDTICEKKNNVALAEMKKKK